MTVPYDLLAFAPHPDDAELFCGGALALAAARGQRVAIVDLTAGELASRGTVEGRRREAEDAARLLGVDRYQLGLPDGGIRDDDASTHAVATLLRRCRPKVVLAPWCEARHPDHAAAAGLVDRAVFVAALTNAPVDGERHRVERVVSYLQRVVPRPDFLVDVTSVWETKRQAIAAHHSQVGTSAGAPPTLIGSADALAALAARDAYWGACLGVSYAEGFCTRAAVPVDDLVDHFSGRPEPHFQWSRS